MRLRLSSSEEIIYLLARVRGRQVIERSTTEPELILEVKTARAAWVLKPGSGRDRRDKEICLGFWPGLELTEAIALAQATKASFAEYWMVPAPPISALFEQYRAEKLDKTATGRAAARSLRHVLAPLFDRDAREVSTQDLQKQLAVVAERAPRHASRCRAYLHAFFNWAQKAGLLEDNPVRSLPRFSSEVRVRRKLELAELLEIWQAADVLPESQAGAVRLHLLLPFPRDEIRLLSWPDLERSEQGLVWWRKTTTSEAPAAKRQPWLLPDAAFAIVSATAASSLGAGPFVFSECRVEGPKWTWAECKRRLSAELSATRAALGYSPMPRWHFDDLPPSFEHCIIEALNADPAVAALCRGKMSPFRSPESRRWAQSSDARAAALALLRRWAELLVGPHRERRS